MTKNEKPAQTDLVKGVIYARYSSSGQRDESIEGQLRDCHAFAEKYGIVIIGEYCDRALTGTSDKRPEFQRMIRDSAKGQFEIVITWKNDRFARSRYDSAVYKYRLKQNGVRVMYAKESIPDGPEGIILESVMEGFAEYYSANLSQNVKRGNYDSALKRQTLGQTLLGLRKGPDGRFELDPETNHIVQRIFVEIASGRSEVDIFTDLNAEGYRTIRGKPFNKNSIRRIARNPKYAGIYQFGDIIDEEGIPRTVSRELFDKVQHIMNQHHHAPAASKDKGGFLLTTKLFCGECGAPMTGDSGTGRRGRTYYYYTCKNRREKKCNKERAPKQWIEDLVISELVKIIHDDAIIQEFADRFMEWQKSQNNTGAVASLETRLKKVEAAIKNTLSVIDSGLVTDSIKSHLMELEAERADLEAGLAKERMENSELSRDTVIWHLEKLRRFDQSDEGWRVYLVDTFLQAAYLYDDGRLILNLNFGGNKNQITLQTAEKAASDGTVLGSSLETSGVPKKLNGFPVELFYYFKDIFEPPTSRRHKGGAAYKIRRGSHKGVSLCGIKSSNPFWRTKKAQRVSR